MRRLRKRPVRHHRGPAGFTLMEVLLVLAILGVIIGLVLPNLLGTQQNANIQATKLQIKGIEQAAKVYALDHAGTFPPSIEELFMNNSGDTSWKGPYLENTTQTPADPWQMPIQYAYPGQFNQTGPDIWSFGPDKQNNTADDVQGWVR